MPSRGQPAKSPTAEEARAADAMLAGILSIAADAIITIDEQHRIIHFNRGAEEIFGWPANEIMGQPLNRLLPERFQQRHDEFIEEFGRGAESARRMGHRREVAGRRKSGAEFPAEASISRLDLPGGRRVYTAVVRDVTERRRAQEDERFLAESAARLAASLVYEDVLQAVVHCAVPALGDACLLESTEGPELFRRAGGGEGRLASDRSDALARAHARLVVPLLSGERVLGALILLALEPERTFGPDARALAEKFAAQAAVAIENAKLYRDAQRATAARDQVLGVVSHDLRNPISAIAMCARALGERTPETVPERENLLTTIVESTEWMQRLIADLLDVASIETGRLSLDRQAEDVSALLTPALRMFGVELAQRHIQLTAEIPEQLPPVLADGSRVVQVLGNLLRNAMTFTPDGGRIVVRAEPRAHEVVISVCDTGAGIPLADQPHVFDRFFHSRGRAGRRGTGLGLSIARGIVEAHGGRIWLESAPGQGSTFFFSIPAVGS
ncbi:MAG TPA: ATP-binding protein [Gemmatimonadaceae bacterium]|nr:ATP-binding protein [Gemmatimonadaceae bacterium]